MLMRTPESLNHDKHEYGDIKRKVDASYNANQSIWQVYWNEATLDVALEAGLTDLQAGTNSTFTNNNNRGQFYFNVVPLPYQARMVTNRQQINYQSYSSTYSTKRASIDLYQNRSTKGRL